MVNNLQRNQRSGRFHISYSTYFLATQLHLMWAIHKVPKWKCCNKWPCYDTLKDIWQLLIWGSQSNDSRLYNSKTTRPLTRSLLSSLWKYNFLQLHTIDSSICSLLNSNKRAHWVCKNSYTTLPNDGFP